MAPKGARRRPQPPRPRRLSRSSTATPCRSQSKSAGSKSYTAIVEPYTIYSLYLSVEVLIKFRIRIAIFPRKNILVRTDMFAGE